MEDRLPEVEKAYRERRKGFIAWAKKATRSLADAEDLVQDAFAKAFANIESLAGVDDLEAWLFATVRNNARDRWRRGETKKRAGEISVSDEAIAEIVAATGLDPEEEALSSELLDALYDAVDGLPAEQRMVIEAQVMDGLTFREIAEASGISQNTLAARKRYGLEKLAEALQEWIDL
jgi:RNA polymerase sigma factor (sigma-70 family)